MNDTVCISDRLGAAVEGLARVAHVGAGAGGAAAAGPRAQDGPPRSGEDRPGRSDGNIPVRYNSL